MRPSQPPSLAAGSRSGSGAGGGAADWAEAAVGPTGVAGEDGFVRNGRREEEGEEETGQRERETARGVGFPEGGGGEGGNPAFHVARPARLLQLSERGSDRRARRGEAEGEGRKTEVIGAEQEQETMSGRPRTTSFAESCKQVQQPSAFGSMKVSREYPTALRGVGGWASCLALLGLSPLRPFTESPAGGRASERPQPRLKQIPFSPLPPSPPINLE